jgi:DNA-directed RNA polymerase specialized sigma24 family protein
MSAAVALPYVWAESKAVRREPYDGIAFYRKRTEQMLRRYVLVALQVGRVPSLIGNSVFRGKASSYRMRSFEDAVIFVFDIEKCLKNLNSFEQELIARIALQEYTQEEAAKLLDQAERTITRKYPETLDKLSRIFLRYGLLERSS